MSKDAVRLKVSRSTASYISPDSPKAARTAVAKGDTPLEGEELVTALYFLANDKDQEVRREAQKSLLVFPPEKLQPILSAPDTHPGILDYLARIHANNSFVLETIAQNSGAAAATIERIAEKAGRKLIEIICRDAHRIKDHPAILKALKKNPAYSPELLAEITSNIEAGPSEERSDAVFSKKLIRETDGEDTGEADAGTAGMYAAILKMGVSEKIKLAITGNKEARGILVKEANRLICMNVIKNPRITESEILLFSASKNVSEEVLRMIAANKDWVKKYEIKLSLASNSRVPIPIAMKFLNHIRDKDLELLSKSRNVSKAVSNMARRILIGRKG